MSRTEKHFVLASEDGKNYMLCSMIGLGKKEYLLYDKITNARIVSSESFNQVYANFPKYLIPDFADMVMGMEFVSAETKKELLKLAKTDKHGDIIKSVSKYVPRMYGIIENVNKSIALDELSQLTGDQKRDRDFFGKKRFISRKSLIRK